MDGRKPRADAKLRNLPPDQRTKLTDWLVDGGLSYKEAKDRLAAEFGLNTSVGAIADFYAKECWTLRFRKARGVADEIGGILSETPGAFDEATITAISQRAFELAVAKDGDPKDLIMLMQALGDTKRLAIEQAKLEVSREKNAQAAERIALEGKKVDLMQVKAAEAVLARSSEIVAIASDSGLSSQEKVNRARQLLFGAPVDGKEAA